MATTLVQDSGIQMLANTKVKKLARLATATLDKDLYISAVTPSELPFPQFVNRFGQLVNNYLVR